MISLKSLLKLFHIFYTALLKSALASRLILQDGTLRLSLYLVCLSWIIAQVERSRVRSGISTFALKKKTKNRRLLRRIYEIMQVIQTSHLLVESCSINHSVSTLQSKLYGLLSIITQSLEHPKTEERHFVAVV